MKPTPDTPRPAEHPERAALELRALLDAAVDAVIVIDHRGLVETFNRSAERLFGYAADEVIGRNVSILMPAGDRDRHDAYMDHYMSTGTARIIGIGRDVMARRRDGTEFPAALSVGKIPGYTPPRFVGFIHDITLRRAAIDGLRRERDRAQRYLDLAEVMLIALDDTGRIALINRKGCEILGYAESELVGYDWFDRCIPAAARANARRELALLLAASDSGPAEGEAVALARGGNERMIAWRTTVVRDEAGRPIGVLSSGEDVTEQRRAARELVKREALLRAAQEVANLGNYEVRLPHGAPQWSEQLFRITGRERAAGALAPEALIEQLVHADDRDRVRHEWQRATGGGGTFDQVFRIVRADGTVREVHGRAELRTESAGGEVSITGTLHDVTERRRAEEELRQEHERLQHVARLSTMGEMATGLAHEINQPLTAIATYAQAAQRLLASPAGVEQEDLGEALTQITNQALRAGEVIRRLREFVRNRTTSTESIDLNRLIEDLRVLAEPDARVNDVRLRLELAPTVPLVAADPVQIQQVLLNLVRNAIDATLETAGAPREIVIRTGTEAGAVKVEVVDRAGGIDPGIAANLFNPFFTTKKTGTGLGLAISRSIIRAHRGKLSHQPTPGGGTTFGFTIPVLPGG